MAGDWIKMETELHEKPEVIEMSGILGLDRFSVVGRLHRVWSWFNKHTESGHARSVTFVTVDEFTSCDGFSEAMEKVGWAQLENGEFLIPKFERHNGNPAKSRALAAERKKKSRSKRDACHGRSVTETGQERDQRREEKRREESSSLTTTSPNGSIATESEKEERKDYRDSIGWNSSDGFTGISEHVLTRWSEAYPACDLKSQIARASEWLMANPAKRKRNPGRFLVNWLSKAQEKGGDIPSNEKNRISSNTSSRNRGTTNEGKESQYGAIG
jgi:hypothetical protein